MSSVQLIVGLGNPGNQYDRTRHNAGFWFVDEVAHQYGEVFRPETKFLGEVAKIQIDGSSVWLLKPATFMNRSGQSVLALAQFYKIPVESILIVHDELDLPAGTARLKVGGGHGGHNGLRDTIAVMGKSFVRLRLGIDHPGHRNLVVDYVLKPPSKSERVLIDEAIEDAIQVLPDVISGNLQSAMQRLHSQ